MVTHVLVFVMILWCHDYSCISVTEDPHMTLGGTWGTANCFPFFFHFGSIFGLKKYATFAHVGNGRIWGKMAASAISLYDISKSWTKRKKISNALEFNVLCLQHNNIF